MGLGFRGLGFRGLQHRDFHYTTDRKSPHLANAKPPEVQAKLCTVPAHILPMQPPGVLCKIEQLGWPLKPIEKYEHIWFPIKAIRDNNEYPRGLPRQALGKAALHYYPRRCLLGSLLRLIPHIAGSTCRLPEVRLQDGEGYREASKGTKNAVLLRGPVGGNPSSSNIPTKPLQIPRHDVKKLKPSTSRNPIPSPKPSSNTPSPPLLEHPKDPKATT